MNPTNKEVAKTIARSGITVGQIKVMLRAAYDDGAPNENKSTVNNSMSKAAEFNIFWEVYIGGDSSKMIKGVDCTIATNALREFGHYWEGELPNKKRPTKSRGDFFHQPVIDIYKEGESKEEG